MKIFAFLHKSAKLQNTRVIFEYCIINNKNDKKNFVNLRYKLQIPTNTKVNSVVFVAKLKSFSLWEYI